MLRIPKAQEPILRRLADLSPADRTILTEALDAAGPRLYVRDLARNLADQGVLDLETTMGIFTVVASLHASRLIEKTDTAANVVEAAVDADLVAGDKEAENLRAAIEMLVTSQTIRLTLKAEELAVQSERVFSDVRILTDLRPVFADDDTIAAGIILHHMRIEQLGPNAMAVMLDDADLDRLEAQITRARLKGKKLREKVEESGVKILVPRGG